MYIKKVGKSDDSSAGRIAEAEKTLGRFQNNPPWVLSKEQLRLANQRLKQILLPSHLDFNPQCVFTHPSQRNSHDWQQVSVLLPTT